MANYCKIENPKCTNGVKPKTQIITSTSLRKVLAANLIELMTQVGKEVLKCCAKLGPITFHLKSARL